MTRDVEQLSAMIVDDAVDITMMLDVILRRAGYDVYIAFTGRDALRAAREKRFHLIISDIGMPLMDGYELCRELRALPGYAQIPFIAITGYDLYDDRRRATECGYSELLVKPIDPKELIELIARLRH